ncbi:hypothetical protein [Arundinibacter roseus]|uniref:GLPGLI family protein n=1 Tax=Arundinibacter roseus TaxID=2070510 RepID=A0A4V2X936_9BACT|nr:hypothetical protein [Arundinibacter roseus]TDB62285.1 hypothetical protein EZE20_18035 [Arundinibacter roseus]
MKIFIYILFFMSALALNLQAQDRKETMRVKDGGKTDNQLFTQFKYTYDQFSDGIVRYRNGRAPVAKLNYNMLLQEMQFLSPSGDTLSLDQEYSIHAISIQNDTYVYNGKKGFLKILSNEHTVQLAVDNSLQVANVDKIGAYGQSSGVSSIKTFTSFSNGNSSISKLNIGGDVVYSVKRAFFLVDQNDLIFPATKKNFLRLFPNHKEAIADYLKQNQVQFTEEEDLQRLMKFCVGLL